MEKWVIYFFLEEEKKTRRISFSRCVRDPHDHPGLMIDSRTHRIQYTVALTAMMYYSQRIQSNINKVCQMDMTIWWKGIKGSGNSTHKGKELWKDAPAREQTTRLKSPFSVAGAQGALESIRKREWRGKELDYRVKLLYQVGHFNFVL